MKVIGIIFLILAGLLLLLFAAAGYFLCSYSMGVKRQSLEEARRWQEDHYDISWYDRLKKTDYTVKSYDGYVLHAQFLENSNPAKKYVVISHGYTDNRYGSLKYAKMYLDFGFHVVLYDLRAHGLNEPTFVTYSIRESRDLAEMLKDTRERYPGIETLGIHGESLGAATSVAVLKYVQNLDFVTADCGFAEIIPVLKVGLKGMHLPGFFTAPASLWAKIRYGHFYREMRPIDSLPTNRVPILFMHGAADDFIVPEHSKRMKEATAGISEVHLFEGAGHAGSALKAPEEYRKILKEFLEKTGNI